MKKIVVVIVAAIMLCTSALCFASDEDNEWHWITSNSQFGFFVHTDTIRADNQYMFFWEKMFYTEESANKSADQLESEGHTNTANKMRNVSYCKTLLVYDTTNNRIGSLERTYHDKHGNVLIVIKEIPINQCEFTTVSPGNIYYKEIKYVKSVLNSR